MTTMKTFKERDFMDALSYIGYYQNRYENKLCNNSM